MHEEDQPDGTDADDDDGDEDEDGGLERVEPPVHVGQGRVVAAVYLGAVGDGAPVDRVRDEGEQGGAPHRTSQLVPRPLSAGEAGEGEEEPGQFGDVEGQEQQDGEGRQVGLQVVCHVAVHCAV